MPKTLTGRLVSVTPETDGGNVVTAAPATATVLELDDVLDFDDSGWLVVNGGAPVAYTGVDENAGTVTLAAALGVAVEVDDRVDVFNPGTGTGGSVVVEYAAQVLLDDQDPDAKPIEAELAHSLVQLLGTKVRDLTGEWVTLEQQDEASDDYTVVGVSGKRPESDGAYTYNPLAFAYRSIATTSWPSASWEAIPGWVITERQDITYAGAGWWTINTPGLYQLVGTVAFENGEGGVRGARFVFLAPDETIAAAGRTVMVQANADSEVGFTGFQVVQPKRFQAGEQFQLQARQTSGDVLDLLGAADGSRTALEVWRIAP